VYHDGISTIIFAYSSLYEGGDRYETLDSLGRESIPLSELEEEISEEFALEGPYAMIDEVALLHIPDIAHGSVAVAYMKLSGVCDDTFGDGMRRGDDKIVTPQIQLFDSERKEGQIVSESRRGEGQRLYEGDLDPLAQEIFLSICFAEMID